MTDSGPIDLASFDFARFKELLDTRHQWPGNYLFKFICKPAQVARLSGLFPRQEVKVRESSHGKYASINVTMKMNSSDEVIAIYQKAAALVPDLIAL